MHRSNMHGRTTCVSVRGNVQTTWTRKLVALKSSADKRVCGCVPDASGEVGVQSRQVPEKMRCVVQRTSAGRGRGTSRCSGGGVREVCEGSVVCKQARRAQTTEVLLSYNVRCHALHSVAQLPHARLLSVEHTRARVCTGGTRGRAGGQTFFVCVVGGRSYVHEMVAVRCELVTHWLDPPQKTFLIFFCKKRRELNQGGLSVLTSNGFWRACNRLQCVSHCKRFGEFLVCLFLWCIDSIALVTSNR